MWIKHRLNSAKCLDNLIWDGSVLSCATCGDVVGIDWTSWFQILKRYTKHKDAILDYIKKNPHKSTLADPEYDETWEPVRELIAEIASTPHYEPLPFEDDDTVDD